MTRYGYDPTISHAKGAIASAGIGTAGGVMLALNYVVGYLRSSDALPWDASMDLEVANSIGLVLSAVGAYLTRFYINKRKHT